MECYFQRDYRKCKKAAEVVTASAADVTYTGEIQKAVPTVTTAETELQVTGTGTSGAVTLADLETNIPLAMTKQ